jgi:uncharacterized phage-associated protein
MAFDGRAVANYVLDCAQRAGIPVSNLALQKIVFFCHAFYMVETGKPLIKHEFEAWEYGPVLQYVYREFKDAGSSPITARARAMNPLNGNMEVVPPILTKEVEERLLPIINFYSRLAPWDLVELSHAKGGPWDHIWNNSPQVNPGMKIPNEAIRDFYSRAAAGSPIQ